MIGHFKITGALLSVVRGDLARPHPFAYERVGFIAAGLSAAEDDLYILAKSYHPVEDHDYLPDTTVGAMVGPDGIRKALQLAMNEGVAVFHVHSHGGFGRPEFSGIDVAEQTRYVPNFFQVAPQCAHGALVLSSDSAHGHLWLNESRTYRIIGRFTEVGNPLTSWGTA